MDAIAKYEEAKGAPVRKLPLLRDVCVLASLTCLPPDRVRPLNRSTLASTSVALTEAAPCPPFPF